jgi:hypothetical protein
MRIDGAGVTAVPVMLGVISSVLAGLVDGVNASQRSGVSVGFTAGVGAVLGGPG